MREGLVTVSLYGDAIPGRGVDQIPAHPGAPALQEAYIRDAAVSAGLCAGLHLAAARRLGQHRRS